MHERFLPNESDDVEKADEEVEVSVWWYSESATWLSQQSTIVSFLLIIL